MGPLLIAKTIAQTAWLMLTKSPQEQRDYLARDSYFTRMKATGFDRADAKERLRRQLALIRNHLDVELCCRLAYEDAVAGFTEVRALLPPWAVCGAILPSGVVCGCLGSEHFVIWEGKVFKGTTCRKHGGHKFAFARPTA